MYVEIIKKRKPKKKKGKKGKGKGKGKAKKWMNKYIEANFIYIYKNKTYPWHFLESNSMLRSTVLSVISNYTLIKTNISLTLGPSTVHFLNMIFNNPGSSLITTLTKFFRKTVCSSKNSKFKFSRKPLIKMVILTGFLFYLL